MATSKIKFKMSIKEVTFEFEGDYEQGRALQQGISQTMTGLSNLQSRAMGAEEVSNRKLIEARPVEPIVPRKRRKRKSSTATADDGVAVEGDDNAEGADAGAEAATRRSSGVSPTKLLVELRKTGFFVEKRELGQIVGELHRKGYPSIASGHISGPLAKLSRKDVLRRDQNEQKSWVYTEGTNEDLPQ